MSSEGNYHCRGPYFDGTNFASWKHKLKVHILGHNPAIRAIVCIGLQGEFFGGREPNREATAEELKMLQYNAQACDIVMPPIQSYTNHTHKRVRSRLGTHGKISQHNSMNKISHTSIILQARGLESSNTRARS